MSLTKAAKVHGGARSCDRSSMLLQILGLTMLWFLPIVGSAQEPLSTFTPDGTAVLSPAETPPPTPTLTPTPTPRKPVRISFVPPPLEGTISLGIYDSAGKLVRVLHREEPIDSFEAGDDALRTTWDGRSDAGEELPAGKYHGRGFLVGEEIKPQRIGAHFDEAAPAPSITASPAVSEAAAPAEVTPSPATETELAPAVPTPEPTGSPFLREGFTVEGGKPLATPVTGVPPPATVSVRLMPNPLENDERRTIQVAAGHDSTGTFLCAVDGLPLRTVSEEANPMSVLIWPVDAKTLDVFQDDGRTVEQFRLARLNRMMAFDCGDFELK